MAFLRKKHLFSVQSLVFHLFKRCLVDGVYSDSETLCRVQSRLNISAHILELSVAAVREEMKTTTLAVDAVHTNLFRLNICLCWKCLLHFMMAQNRHTHRNQKTESVCAEGSRRCDGGMEQVRKWIDNLFTVLRRYASHRVFYHLASR